MPKVIDGATETKTRTRVPTTDTLGRRLREVADDFNKLADDLDQRGVDIDVSLSGHVLTVERLQLTMKF